MAPGGSIMVNGDQPWSAVVRAVQQMPVIVCSDQWWLTTVSSVATVSAGL
jgi:hypothetical protein